MSDIEDAGPENSLIDLSNNEIEIEMKYVNNWQTSRKTEFSAEYFTETMLCYIFAFWYYHLLFCCKINILHFMKMVQKI